MEEDMVKRVLKDRELVGSSGQVQVYLFVARYSHHIRIYLCLLR